MYILNTSLGVLFTLALPVVYAVKKEAISGIFNIPDMNLPVGVLAILMLSAINSFNFVSAPSISLEGKNLWISLSLPVDSSAVLLSKARMHMVVCIPATLLSAVALIFLMGLNAAEAALLLIVPVVFALFQAYFGVVVNLLFPKFDWINEITPIKQGISSLLAMFAGMGAVALPVILYIAVLNTYLDILLFILLYAAAISILSFGLRVYLKNGGARRFESLAS
jgi:ABC-2 type transport system permease protein